METRERSCFIYKKNKRKYFDGTNLFHIQLLDGRIRWAFTKTKTLPQNVFITNNYHCYIDDSNNHSHFYLNGFDATPSVPHSASIVLCSPADCSLHSSRGANLNSSATLCAVLPVSASCISGASPRETVDVKVGGNNPLNVHVSGAMFRCVCVCVCIYIYIYIYIYTYT